MERLDRVAPSRRLAQIAAVIGREFSCDLLSTASQINEDDMRSALPCSNRPTSSIASTFHRSSGSLSNMRCCAMRSTILCSEARGSRSIADIAAILEKEFPELAESQPEVLAYHYQEARNHHAGHSLLAQSPGIARSGIPPMSKRLPISERRFRLLNSMPETPDRNRQEIAVQLALGIPLIAVKGYASAEIREAFSRARTLCLQLGNMPEYFQALFGLWGHSWMGGKNDDALRIADEFCRGRGCCPTSCRSWSPIE